MDLKGALKPETKRLTRAQSQLSRIDPEHSDVNIGRENSNKVWPHALATTDSNDLSDQPSDHCYHLERIVN